VSARDASAASARRPFRYFDYTVLVRDLDPQGHMANHIYVAYLSDARGHFLRTFEQTAEGLHPSVVADVRCSYVSSLLPFEPFRVGVRVARIGRTSIGFEYEIVAQDRLVARGESVEVLIDPVRRRPREVPPAVRNLLEQA
jgi:acyl-CoA thioester hydrolase